MAGVTGQAVQQDPAALERWRALRAAGDLQMAPPPPWHPPEPPPWLNAVVQWLGERFVPFLRLMGRVWPWLEKALIVAGVLGLVWLGWVLLARRRRRRIVVSIPAEVLPDEEAQALLGDADGLAARGDYAGAVHLLLQRSVAALAAARPGLVHAASTAREIADMAALPAPARAAFGTMVGRVEASRYALRALAQADWLAAREAFAAFASAAGTPA